MAKISNAHLPSIVPVAPAAVPAQSRQAKARQAGPALRSVQTASTRLSARTIAVASGVPSPVDLPRPREPYPALGSLIGESGIPVPDDLIEHHKQTMAALLGQGPTPAALPVLVNDAADSLKQVHSAFVTALPSGPAAASPACQEVASALMGEARLINHIHHTGVVPGQPDHFLAQAGELPPSRLDRQSFLSSPSAGQA